MNIRRSRRRQISQIWINLLATFFFPKFFIKFSRVTNRHLARINLLKNLRFPPHRFSRDKVGTHRSLVRRASAARAILLANAASLYSSQQAAQAVPSQFVAKSGERDGSGASSRTPTLLIFDEKFATFPPHRQIRPQKREIVRGNQTADWGFKNLLKNLPSFLPTGLSHRHSLARIK